MTFASLMNHGFTDTAFRVIAAAVTAYFAVNIGSAWLAAPHDLTVLLLLISETTSLVLIVFSHRAQLRDANVPTMIAAMVASFIVPAFIEAKAGTAVLPLSATIPLCMAGLVWVIWSKISLGRSFGILAARREVRIEGTYKLVRHPIYFGYLIVHMGFLLDNFTLRNIAVIAILNTLQVVRAIREEQILSTSPDYVSYCRAVPYRFVWGVV